KATAVAPLLWWVTILAKPATLREKPSEFRRRTVSSAPAEANTPVAENATAETGPSWSFRCNGSAPSGIDQILTPSTLADASNLPSVLKARDVIGPGWPARVASSCPSEVRQSLISPGPLESPPALARRVPSEL